MLDKERPPRKCSVPSDHRTYFPTHRDYLHRLWHRHATIIDIGEDSIIPDDATEKEIMHGYWWKQLLAGGIAGAVSRTCTAPLDRIKIFFQVSSKVQINSIRGCFQTMVEEGGYFALWRGNMMNVMKIAPETALKFTAYEYMKSLIHPPDKKKEITMGERFLAGSVSGSFSQTMIYPLEVLKTRLSLRKSGEFRGVWDVASRLYRKEGIRAFYRGYFPNLCGIIPYAGIDLAVYETLKAYTKPATESKKHQSILAILFCGTTSSFCGQISCYPFALLRTRMQAPRKLVVKPKSMFDYGQPSPPTLAPPPTLTGEINNILRTDGITGFYRGITASFLKVAPAVSISYAVYEYARVALGIKMN